MSGSFPGNPSPDPAGNCQLGSQTVIGQSDGRPGCVTEPSGMSEYYQRCQEAVTSGFRAFLLAWLADLPPAGWAGTAAELEVEWCGRAAVLPRHQRPIVPGPKGIGQRLRDEERTINGAGWAVGFSRTATARTVKISRVGPPPTDPAV